MLASQNKATWPFSEHQEDRVFQKKTLWLMGVRLVLGTLLMGATLLFQLKNQRDNAEKIGDFVFWLLGALFLVTLLYSLFFQKIRDFRRFISIQFTIDLFLISVLVLSTGCQDSLFLFCYLLVIIGASHLLNRSGSFLFASASLLFLCIILYLNASGVLHTGKISIRFLQTYFSIIKTPSLLSPMEFLYIVLIYGCAFYLVAYLSSQLAEQVRTTGEIIQQQQMDLDNLEALHYDIVTSLPSGLLTTDGKGKIRSFNQSAREILGQQWKNVYGKTISEIFPLLQEDFTQRNDSKTLSMEIPLEKYNGEPRTIVLSSSPLRDRHHRKIGQLVLLQDVTELKEIEAVAQRNEKLASLGQLAGGLAHEIRNPLAALSGCIQMLKQDVSQDAESKNLMEIVVKETDRLNSLLNDFLLFAKPREPQRSNFLLEEIIEEIVFLLQMDPTYQAIHFLVEIEEETLLYADPDLFRQIVLNLISNGVQAMDFKGEIKIRGYDMGHGTWIYVEDQGKGMSKELQKSIFNPFFSTKERGTGLGLSVVQRVVSEHHGSIELDSHEGTYTQFRLYFPCEGETFLSASHLEEANPKTLPETPISQKE